MSEISRRAFLKLTAGSGGALAADMGIKQVGKLIPYVIPPEEVRPGIWTHFATTCRECPAGCGMFLRHRDGRVCKAEGNPGHPVNHGGLCPRGQSVVQGLYDPDRVKEPLAGRGADRKPVAWDSAIAAIAQRLSLASGKLTLISDLQTGALADVMMRFAGAFDAPPPTWFEAFNYEPLRKANQALLGQALVPHYRLADCDLLLSFGADFLEGHISPVEFAWGFTQMRFGASGSEEQGRFIYVGPRQSMTAANADDLLLTAPDRMRWVALALVQSVLDARAGKRDPDDAILRALAGRLGATYAQEASGMPARRLASLSAQLLAAKRPLAMAGPTVGGGQMAYDTAVAVALLNIVIGAVGGGLDLSNPHALSRTADSQQLRQTLESITPDHVVIIHNANLAYSLPQSAVDLKRAGMVVYLGTMLDETAELAHYVLPVDSPLESWGDYEPYEGTHCLLQPTMARLHNSQACGDVLMDIAQGAKRTIAPADAPAGNFRQWLSNRWTALHGSLASGQPFEEFWKQALRDGGVFVPPAATQRGAYSLSTGGEIAFGGRSDGVSVREEAQLWVWPHIMFFDGRLANRGWMQESPEPISYAVWGSWIDMHPSKALGLGLCQGDMLEVKTDAGSIEAPVRLTEDIAPSVIALGTGQGHTALGRNAANRGANAMALLGLTSPETYLPRVTLRKVGQAGNVIYTSPTQSQYHRELLQWVKLSELRKMQWGQGDDLILPLPEGYKKDRDLYPPHEHRNHRWAMVIDLERCIGCGACAVACYAENNVPVMGPARVDAGREMAWLKVVPYRSDHEPGRLAWLPMLCQHCDSAPCEPVCPVFAAVHNEEGLNSQVYNRCIGTRYCSNNCPYKVRRFNWFDVDWPKPLDWQLNPDVTARSRGVMEKCTFCIQRIREVENRAKLEHRPVRDGEVQPACAQSCPTRAIVFGDLMDAQSQVTKLTRNHPRRYHVLEELNTKVAVTYLRRIHADESHEGQG